MSTTSPDCNKTKRRKYSEGSDSSFLSGTTSVDALSETGVKPTMDTDKCQVDFAQREGEVITDGRFTVGKSEVTRYPTTIPPIIESMTADEKTQRRKVRNRISAQQHRERQRKYVGTLNELVQTKNMEIENLSRKIDEISKKYEEMLHDIRQKHTLALEKIAVMKEYMVPKPQANGDGHGTVLQLHLDEEPVSSSDNLMKCLMALEDESAALACPHMLMENLAPINMMSHGDSSSDAEIPSTFGSDCQQSQPFPGVVDLFDCETLNPLTPLAPLDPLDYCQYPDYVGIATTEPVKNVTYSPICKYEELDVEVAAQSVECSDTLLPPTQCVSSPSLPRAGGRLRMCSMLPILLGVSTLGMLCFSSLTQWNGTGSYERNGDATAVRRLINSQYELLKDVKNDRDVFNRMLGSTKETPKHQYIASPPWKYSKFDNVYDDKKIQHHINSVELKLSSNVKEQPSKEVAVQSRRWIDHHTNTKTSSTPKVSYIHFSEDSSMNGNMRTDLVLQSLPTTLSSASEITSHNDDEMKKKNKELVLHDQFEESRGAYSFSSATFSTGSSSINATTDGVIFNADTQHLVVLVPLISIKWGGVDVDLVNSWIGNDPQSQYLEISCLVQNVRSLHEVIFPIR